jgi:hypothetical protein
MLQSVEQSTRENIKVETMTTAKNIITLAIKLELAFEKCTIFF